MLDIVVTHETDVVGHRELSFAQRLHGADRGHVVDRKDRSRKGIERQHLLGGAIAPDTIDGGAKHQVLRIGDAGCFECLAVAFQTVAAGRDVVRFGEKGNAAMADAREMLDQTAGAGNTVADDEIAIDIGERAIEKHNGKSALHERRKNQARAIAGGGDQQAFDAMFHEIFDIFAFEAQVAFAVA